MTGSAMLSQTRWTVLLSVNAAAILIAGILITSAIWLNGGLDFRAVNERSDIINDNMGEFALLESVSKNAAAGLDSNLSQDEIDAYAAELGDHTYSAEYSDSSVPDGEIWNAESMVIYATPDVDICVDGGLSDLGEMYWQTSDTSVIAGFYDSARTWLGYDSATCRYPVVKGVGTVTVTAGTYDGRRKDSILVTVIDPPVEQWKHEVLSLVNNIRANSGLSPLSWGVTCEPAANLRAKEITSYYSHNRPDGSSWSTACPVPDSGGTSGENLAIGNAAVSPFTVVMLWMGSDSHRANIMNPDYTKLSVGFLFDINSNYRTYWSQFFSTY